MPQVKPSVQLIRYTPAPQELVAMAGKICYSASDLGALRDGVEARDQAKYLEKVTGMGHHSLLEHASFTFGIEGVSRSLLAQITRHRIASFSVQSQRYVALGDAGCGEGFDYIVPPAISALGEEAIAEFHAQMAQIDRWYQQWRERLGGETAANEDARFVLPNAAATRMITTMNARELLHFFEVRGCNRAQWEINEISRRMFALCYREAPALFGRAGPKCLYGACPEGKMSCGRAGEVRREFAALRDGVDMAREGAGEPR